MGHVSLSSLWTKGFNRIVNRIDQWLWCCMGGICTGLMRCHGCEVEHHTCRSNIDRCYLELFLGLGCWYIQHLCPLQDVARRACILWDGCSCAAHMQWGHSSGGCWAKAGNSVLYHVLLAVVQLQTRTIVNNSCIHPNRLIILWQQRLGPWHTRLLDSLTHGRLILHLAEQEPVHVPLIIC